MYLNCMKKKWLIIPLFIIGFISMFVNCSGNINPTHWGPISFTIAPNDGAILEDAIVVYGASEYTGMHGATNFFSENVEIVSHQNKVTTTNKIEAFNPTFIIAYVNHPLYYGDFKRIKSRDVNGNIDFGVIKMYSYELSMKNHSDSIVQLESIFKELLQSIESNYTPNLKKIDGKINIERHVNKIHELCTMAYKNSQNLLEERCKISKFRNMLTPS